jgi:MORN repeat
MLYNSGNSYEGNWSCDVRSGYGCMQWKAVNERYEGNWSNGKQDGYGVHTWHEEPPSSLAAATAAQRQLCNRYIFKL